MKKILTTAVFALALNTNSFAEELKYNIEPSHTSVVWTANHFGFSDFSGKFNDIEGSINFDEKNPKKSSVDVTIKMIGIDSGVAKLDEHLKSADFFNSGRFPTAKFISKKITVTGKGKAIIEGDLTIIGVTKTVALNTKFNKSGVNPINQKQSIGFSATTSIKRSDFGINYAIPGVSDKVDLKIEVEANK